MNKKLLLFGFMVLIIVTFAIAQSSLVPPGLTNLYGPYNSFFCWETDQGPNIYSASINIAGLALNTYVNEVDSCIDGERLHEGLCGGWIDANYGTTNWNSSAFLLEFNCSASNTPSTSYTCFYGACVPLQNSNVNSPDLIVGALIFNTLNLNNTPTQSLTVHINNTGSTASANSSILVKIGCPAGVWCFPPSLISIPPISGPGTTSVGLGYNFPGPSFPAGSGTYTITVVADGANQVAELNETNNAQNISITI